MISLTQIKTKLGDVLDDLSAAAFAALAWIEEGDNFRAMAIGGRSRKGKPAARPYAKVRSSHWIDQTHR